MQIISLANHFPSRDPRVVWSSTSLATKCNIIVLGREDKGYDKDKFVINNAEILYVNTQRFSFHDLLIFLRAFIKPNLESLLLLMCGVIISFSFFTLRVMAFIFRKMPFLTLPFKNSWLERKSEVIFSTSLHLTWFFNYTVQGYVALKDTMIEGSKQYLVNDLDTLLLGVCLKRKFGGKIIYDMHEFWPYQYKEKYNLMFLYEKRLCKYVDKFITVSSPLLARIRQEYEITKEFFMIPNASPLEISDSDVLTEKKSTDPIIFIYQGSFSKERGMEFLINSWASDLIPSNCLLWVRGPDDSYKASLMLLADNLNINNIKVFFKESVSEEDLINMAMQGHVGVIPYEPISVNNKFCCPNKLSQYMQAGLAILYNNLDFVDEIVTTANCGVKYSSTSVDTFIHAVLTIAKDDDKLEKYRLNARKFALSTYNWDHYEKELFKAFNFPE